MYGNIVRRAIEFQRGIAAHENERTPYMGLTLREIETAVKIFGKENFIIRLYDRSVLKDDNIVADFFDALGIELQGELLEAARQCEYNPKIPDGTLPFLSKLWQITDMNGPDLPVAQAITSKIREAFDPAQQGAGAGLGLEAEIGAIIDEFEALAPGYKELFKDRPCSFSFPEIDLDPKELLQFDLLCSLYKSTFNFNLSGLKEQLAAEIKRILFPNLMQRLVLLLYRPILKLSLPQERYAIFRKAPEDFLVETDRYPVKRLRKTLRFFGPIPSTKRSGK
jgi:hypothetical protein